jgi:hypothetical protein
MANLYVTFSQYGQKGAHQAPVAQGSGCRTEVLVIGASSEATDISAAEGEEITELYAEAACWVTIGVAPEAAEASTDGPTDARYIEEGGRREFSISAGDKVAVIQA